MPIINTSVNSATTLSYNYRPGQNKRLFNSKSDAIFSFGDFTIEKQFSSAILSANTTTAHFGNFDSLETLGAINFTQDISKTYVFPSELNLPSKDPRSHSYFSSFYTNVASSINKIIKEYPYAILSYNNGNVNIFDYTEIHNQITLEITSSFKVPFSGLTNQGEISLNSANTQSNFSLPYDYKQFCIQLSGSTDVFNIKNYIFSGTYLYFEIYGFLKNSGTTTQFSDAIYIRPTKERMFNYKHSLTSLELQLLDNGKFLIPAVNIEKEKSFEQTFLWPRTIDGWAPDTYGYNYEIYQDSILKAAEKVDEEKTDIFIRTVIPENYLELDSEGNIYRSIIQSYAYEFDKIKKYIDAIAYAHSVEYNNEETVPKKFMMKLSNLLGWKLSDGFSELNLFEYLTSDLDESTNSYSYFNTEIWRRILVNLVWLYKKKGTRDAITFIFKLIGAPEEMVKFDEFVYDILPSNNINSPKVSSIDSYPNYSWPAIPFQSGGHGRGNGQDYISQWVPEFNPVKKIDNIKIGTGSTRSILNTKELDLGFYPSQAIEYDVWQYYQNPCSVWTWGSPCPPFSSLTTPFEYLTFDSAGVQPSNISQMSLSQYIDYVYTKNIDPTTRKTNNQAHTAWTYPELKNIYLAYYYASYPENNHLNNCKLEAYLQLLEVELGSYITQLIPATTIFWDNAPAVYKNTAFHRQRFVYKEGVDKGSMFKRELNTHPQATIHSAHVRDIGILISTNSGNIPSGNVSPLTNITMCNINGQYIHTKTASIKPVRILCNVNLNSVNAFINAVSTDISVSQTSQFLSSEGD